MEKKNVIMLLTATVNVDPKVTTSSKVNYFMDPAKRLEEYKAALTLYADSKVVTKVVFVENSGVQESEFDEIKKLYKDKGKELNLILYKTEISSSNKNLGEIEEMQKFAETEDLSKLDFVFQQIGRVRIPNVDKIISEHMDEKSMFTNYFYKRGNMETWVMMFPAKVYSEIIKSKQFSDKKTVTMNDSIGRRIYLSLKHMENPVEIRQFETDEKVEGEVAFAESDGTFVQYNFWKGK